jgi:2-polyprenyl-3-methyl-5-hydroxy-6-metoxy-1,4-benzoquinol methylase
LIQSNKELLCFLCGGSSRILYEELTDRMYGVYGKWNYMKCINNDCGLIWIYPMHKRKDLKNLYQNYYTHKIIHEIKKQNKIKRNSKIIANEYLRKKFGYPHNNNLLTNLLGSLIHFYQSEGSKTFLNYIPNGRLLDVGCGSGVYLKEMQNFGWTVEGVEFDPVAANEAISKGLNVHCGSLEDQSFPEAHFDAVTLNHVIEHLIDPFSSLKECFRILKPGGQLLIFTPNTDSFGHRLFKNNWRGIETPRHLYVFSKRSLYKILRKANFGNVLINPQIGSSLIRESLLLCNTSLEDTAVKKKFLDKIPLYKLLLLIEFFLVTINPTFADCLGVLAKKQGSAQ